MRSWHTLRVALALALSAAGRGAPTAEEVMRSAASCDGGLGADGYLITLKRATGDAFAADIERKWEGRRKLQQEESAENKMLFTYSTSRVFRGVAARLDDSELQDVLDNEEVDHIAPNCLMQLSPEETKQAITDEAQANERSVTTSSYTGYQAAPPSWGLDRIDSREGLDGNYTFGSATGVSETGPVVVYVLDTGIQAVLGQDALGMAHTAPLRSPGQNVRLHLDNRTTCCPSIFAALHAQSTSRVFPDGVAKGATVVAVQVLDCYGRTSVADLIAGIEWAVGEAEKIDVPAVISMSLVGGTSAVYSAVEAAHAAGVSVVLSAGNDNADACGVSPASASHALTVGSTTASDTRSSFSNYGPCVDIFAPGSDITSAWSGADSSVRTFSGTSMAASHVAGAVAQLRAMRPELDSTRVKEVVICMATRNVLQGIPLNTPNSLLWAGLAISEQSNTECLSPPPMTPPMPGICTDSCSYASDNVIASRVGEKMIATMAGMVQRTICACLAQTALTAAFDHHPSPPSPRGVCEDSCDFAFDGECDDGGAGAEFSMCHLGSDCSDCQERQMVPPSPASPPDAALPLAGECFQQGPGVTVSELTGRTDIV
ncbi:MAG: hypothetical protein SGPRY_012312 [Prymnesium sp.]